MKHLGNCTPREFMTQTVKMRRDVEKWLADTGMSEIRKRVPEGYEKMKPAERAEAINRQANENMGDMLWAAMEKDPEGTLHVLGLCTFSDAGADDAPAMSEYLGAVLEMMSNEAVRNFFMLCLRPAQTSSSED